MRDIAMRVCMCGSIHASTLYSAFSIQIHLSVSLALAQFMQLFSTTTKKKLLAMNSCGQISLRMLHTVPARAHITSDTHFTIFHSCLTLFSISLAISLCVYVCVCVDHFNSASIVQQLNRALQRLCHVLVLFSVRVYVFVCHWHNSILKQSASS